VEHHPGTEQFQVRSQSAATALQGAKKKHPPGMIKQQIILGLPD
jgi:hypothetical protein